MAYPGGKSHSQAIQRVAGFLADLPTRWAGQRVALVGHLATYRALEHVINGHTVQDLVAAGFEWRAEGWEYRLG
jgi:2,3-bisphosphoglycerate-dependent phosphoglycerate mutase